MSTIRIGTFNCENLFARYRFKQNLEPTSGDGWTINDMAFDIHNDTEKRITAKAIRELNADILALQEVESLETLDRFHSQWLASKPYAHRMVIDTMDPRHIDVGLLSRHPITAVRSYRHRRNKAGTSSLFSRDCMEVDIDVEGKSLTLYINHFLSMMKGREESHERRAEQVKAVADILDARWEKKKHKGNFIVLGDFNDYVDKDTSLKPLVKHPHLENVLDRLPADERWTHYWAGGGEYRQLDYLLVSKTLAEKNSDAEPVVMRKGLPYRATQYDGDRFDDVGEHEPKASDHCPLAIDLTL